ncbi:MAG: L,D-transpeptidase family protein [Eubacterium sp.]|nr:L,D-transpeptidase family protein [Eubacterium sp.]
MSRKKKVKKSHKALKVFLTIVGICVALTAGLFVWNTWSIRQKEFQAAEIDFKAKLEVELEAARKAAAEEAARIAAEEEAKRKAEEEAARKKAEEEAEAARKKAEEEAAKAREEALLKAHPELTSEITYTLPSGDRVLDRKTIETWLVDNGDGTMSTDEEKWYSSVRQYVADMAAEVDSVGKPRPFNATGLGVITIPTGTYYGWEIDEETEYQILLEELAAGTKTTREPVYLCRELFSMNENYGIGPDYIEVDLSRQYLWLYKGGVLQYETNVTSGLMDTAHYTPEGVYPLLSRETNATLKGDRLPNGKYTYQTKVSFWMPFTYEGHGLHDASWRGWFGGDTYIWDGSHGCINLPYDAAAFIFDMVYPDMPVVTYYSQYYELREAPPIDYSAYLYEASEETEEEEEEEEEPVEEELPEEVPMEEAPMEEAPMEEVPMEEVPMEEVPMEEAPVELVVE